MKTQTVAYVLVLLAGIFPAAAGRAAAQTKADKSVVWQIGEFDQTSREFGHNFDLDSDSLAPVFVVGKSKTEDWPAWQTTSVKGAGEKHPTAYTILFSLPQAPEGSYHLTIAALLVNPTVPDLLIELNGRKGRYYFERKISYYPVDERID